MLGNRTSGSGKFKPVLFNRIYINVYPPFSFFFTVFMVIGVSSLVYTPVEVKVTEVFGNTLSVGDTVFIVGRGDDKAKADEVRNMTKIATGICETKGKPITIHAHNGQLYAVTELRPDRYYRIKRTAI